nr:FtsX-like permease family protein [Pyrinomonadaceae bacterium]
VFVPLKRLQEDLEQEGRVNTVLVAEQKEGGRRQKAEGSAMTELVEEILRDTFALEDLGIKLRVLNRQSGLQLESNSALINDALAEAARGAATDLGMRTSAIFTYLANTIRSGEREIPYSVVTALDQHSFDQLRGNSTATTTPAPLQLNEWAARDLGIKPGDEVSLEYYIWQDEGRLLTRTAQFQLTGIVAMDGIAVDRNLVPEYPGITGSESLSDWDPPFPVDLRRVRPRDEDYWNQYRTAPKAFITLDKGQELWQSRFGKFTSLRILPTDESNLESARDAYQRSLRTKLNPAQFGLTVQAARAEGLAASRGATDFGEYFVYFSFFLVVSALLLTSLFFKLGIEQRLREIGLLRAIGFPASKIRTLFLSEAIVLAGVGSILGLIGAVIYGWVIMLGLRTWWVDAVGTKLLSLHVSPTSLILGAVGGVLAALLCIVWTLRGLMPISPRSLLAGGVGSGHKAVGERRQTIARLFSFSLPTAYYLLPTVLCLLAFVLLLGAWLRWISPVAGFFGAGTLLLIGLLCFQLAWLRRDKRKLLRGRGWWAISRLGFRNSTYRPGRSVLSIALIASATFVIVAVDAFRRDTRETSFDRKSGNGGFPLLAESLLPLFHDPNTADGREALNLVWQQDSALASLTFTRFRLRPGDDASCLNLYQPLSPRILAPTGDFVASNRFAFQSSLAETEEEKANPWLLLNKETTDGAVPVIADANSMTYVLHLKLGDQFVMNESGADPIRMRLVGALADSILQGELLMSERNFLRLFPDQQGYRFFLLDVPESAKQAEVAAGLEDQLSDFGFDVRRTTERLANFHRVENTYLSTFQSLGGLGLVLGTLGLATVLLRNVLERRRELALLRAVGYKRMHFAIMIIAETLMLLFFGLLTGTACALLAIAPTVASRGGHLPTFSLALLLFAVLVTGLTASLLATAAALRSPLLPALRAE